MQREDIRLALPSKGILQDESMSFLKACGLEVFRPNARQYVATINGLPGVTVLFQRPGDIVVGVQAGSVDFGITGYDGLAEKTSGRANGSGQVMMLHSSLGFGSCTLNLAVPEELPVYTLSDLKDWSGNLDASGRVLRIATKFPNLTALFLDQWGIHPYKLIGVEGTLEIAPAIGFADMISDLVSSGITLRDNHLRPLDDGQILASEAVLIANKESLRNRPEVLAVARYLLEFIEAHQRASGSFLVTANMRGESAEAIAACMFEQTNLGGLQGPTIAPVFTREGGDPDTRWYAVNIVVRKEQLFQAVGDLRAIGGSGVVVAPCAYIFEEEPEQYRAMLVKLAAADTNAG